MIMVHSIFRTLRRSRASFVAIISIGLLVLVLFGEPLLLIRPAIAPPTTVLTPKWTRTGLGTNWEGGLVIGDITGDGQEDIVYAGGGSDVVYVLDGDTGSNIATYTNGRIGTYCQPQLYDVDGDGVLDILVPLFSAPGLAAVKYDGDSSLALLWSVNTEGANGSGSVMAKAVAGDIDHDGHLDIFVASQDVSPANNQTGTPIYNGYDGTITRINYLGQIVASTFTWRPCSGGLSLADTDNDGVFELYQGDRNALSNQDRSGYSDGGYGKGTRSLWADNLTERWNRDDFLSSSQSPVLADVNNDGILDVISGMYNEIDILNSTNGAMIKRWRYGNLSVHYGFTVYDIDGDGHLELLANDGDHDDNPFTDVIDLVTGHFDAELNLNTIWDPVEEEWVGGGDWKWGPLVADISPTSPGMEIISCPNGTGLDGGDWYHGAIMIWSSSYESLQNVTRRPGTTEGTYSTTRLGSQLGYPFVQDIDGDGLLEFVTHASNGIVYAFNTSAPAPGYSPDLPGSERIRSEVTYFGEARLGVAEHTIMPWGEDYWTAPLVAPVSPGDNALAVPVSTDHLSFNLSEHQSDPITYTVTTSPGIGSGAGSNSSNSQNWSTYNLYFNRSLEYDTTYAWRVSATDGVNSTVRTYSFRTELAPKIGNRVPTQGTPSLDSQDGMNTTTSTFQSFNQSTGDQDGDQTTNIYRWLVNGVPVANLLLPFDTQNETMTKDYSGFGNNAIVKGATWTENGLVGGAYSFDGKDDAIIVRDGGVGYFDNVTHPASPYHPELGGRGRWQEITVEAWIYLTAYNNGSRIVAKLPSYELGFASGYTNRLIASVWPDMGKIAPITTSDSNQALTNSIQSVTATVDIQLNTWYHIAFTYKMGVGLKLYFNGALVAQKTNVPAGPIQNSLGEPIYIGRLVQPFAGMIDDVRMYRYAQPAEQIYSRYLESKDGLSNSSLFYPLGIGVPGDVLTCQVIPTDSFEQGNAVTSASMILLDSPPIASNLQIYPVRARNLRLDTEDLTASYVYYDADGNNETNSGIRWYLNGVLQSGFDDDTVIPAGSTSMGDEWHFTVKPRDSLGGYGDLQTSYNVTIYANTAPSTGTPQLVSSVNTNRDDEDLIASAQGTSDSDDNPVTNIYHWTLEGDSLTNLQMPFDTETPLYLDSNSTTKDYSGYGNDGTVVGAQWVGDGIVGGGYYFDGHDYIRVDENGDSLGGDGTWSEISVEFWVKAPAGTTSSEHVIFKHDLNFSTSTTAAFGVGYMADFRARGTRNQITWYIYRSGGVNSTTYQLYDDPLGWHHVVCTYESGVGLRIYMDGLQRVALLNVTITGNINATLDGLLDIGGYASGGTDFSGTLDEIRIYPKVLSPAQIFQRFIETKDGFSDSNTIAAQETAPGDDWVCQVIPNDSWDDGTLRDSSGLHVSAVVGNSRPRIDWYSPASLSPGVNEGSSLAFAQFSSDPDGDPLSYSWELDSVLQATTQNWTYSPDFYSAGLHSVKVTVSDGSLSDSQEWQVTVNDVAVQYELTIQAGSGGTTDPIPDAYDYAESSNVPVTAIPYANMELNYWLLDGVNVGNDNPYTVAMDTDHYLTAVFAAISGGGGGGGRLLVQGAHDEIYHRLYNSTTSSWEDWRVIPDGATPDSPAGAVYSGKLYFVVRGMDGQSLWFGSVNLTDYSFSGWTGLSGATPSAPALTVYGSKLILVVRGLTNVIWYRYYDTVSETWGEWIAIQDGATCDSPAAEVLGTNLHLVVRGFSTTDIWGNNTLWHGIVSLADDSFSGWTYLPGATPSAPTLAASETLGSLYLSVRGMSDVIWTNKWNGAVWEGWTALPDGATIDSPTVAVVNGELHIVVRDITGDALWHYYIDLLTEANSGWIRMDGWTPSAPTLAS